MIKDILCDKCPSFSGILSGIAKGDYWLNDRNDPTVAVIYSYCVGGCGILGKVTDEQEFERFLKTRVFIELKKKGINEFEFSSENNSIYEHILKIFCYKKIMSEEEYSYRIDTGIETSSTVPDIYQIVEVDKNFLGQLRERAIMGSHILLERIDNSWDDEEAFLKNSLAYVTLHQKSIVGVIFGSARYDKYVDIDIETCKEHRNKGIASGMTNAFVNKCIEKGYVAQWDCVDSNTASKALAEKCGFKMFKVRPYYWFDID